MRAAHCISSLNAIAETEQAEKHHRHAEGDQRIYLGPEQIRADAFKDYPSDNDEEVADGHQVCEILHDDRHVGDREYEAGEQLLEGDYIIKSISPTRVVIHAKQGTPDLIVVPLDQTE